MGVPAPRSELRRSLGERQLLTALLAFACWPSRLLSLLIGRWLSIRVMSPVIDLAERVQQMRQTGKPEPLAPHFANDEVGQLAAALDDYSDKLTALVERDREFNADVSHELRTPLAVISTHHRIDAGRRIRSPTSCANA